MKKQYRKFVLLILANGIWGTMAFAQQLPQYSQYVFNSLHINPGYAGYKIDPFVQATYRSQFIEFPGAPKTFSVSADMASGDETMGFGISLISDQIGATNINSALLTYAYRIKVRENAYLSLGVSAGSTEYVLDGSQLNPDDPTDTSIPSTRLNMFTPNLNTGLFFYTERFFAGLSMFNLVGKRNLENEDMALAVHDYHYYFQIGTLMTLSDIVEFKPSLMVREDLRGPTNYDVNAMFLFYDRIWLGASYRSNMKKKGDLENRNLSNRDAVAAILDVFLTDNLRFGYAYDFNLNSQSNYRNSSHEISIGYYFGSKALGQNSMRCF